MLSFQFHSRILVVVPSRIVGVAENTGGIVAREDVTEVAKISKIERKTVIVDKLPVVSQILLPL